MKPATVIMAAAVAMAFTGCSATQPPLAPTASSARPVPQVANRGTATASADTTSAPKPRDLKFKLTVKQRCTTTSGLVRGVGSGFTPLGEYWTRAKYPNGAPYPEEMIKNPGTAGKDGTTTTWKWPCGPDDPPGKYRITVTDDESQSSISFTITVHKS